MGFVKMMFKTSCIASHLHCNYIFMHFRYVLYMLNCLCAVRIGLGWAHDVFKFACHMFMHFHAYVPSCFYLLILNVFDTFLILTLSLSLSLTLVASWHLNVNPLYPWTFFVLGYLLLLLLTSLHLTYGSMMRRPNRTSWRTFHDEVFIRNAKSFCQIFLRLTYPLSSTVGVGSHCVASRSHALSWSYRSSIPICRI